MKKYNNYYTNDNQKKYNREINYMTNRELISTKMRDSKWWMRANTIRDNEKLDNFLTNFYYDNNKRKKIIEGVERGLTSVESIKSELNECFEFLTNTEKQALGMALSMIMDEESYFPTRTIPIFNCLNIKNSTQFSKC